jgi:hypothetical protein
VGDREERVPRVLPRCVPDGQADRADLTLANHDPAGAHRGKDRTDELDEAVLRNVYRMHRFARG